MKTETPLDLGAKCKRCPFAVRGFPAKCVMGEGPLDPIGIFIGESPGRDEVDRKRPFVGATGQELDESFLRAKLPRAKLFIVNAIACLPTLAKSEADMRRAADRCRPALIAQLSRLANVNTLPVFAAGKWALYGLTGDFKGMKNHRGFIKKWKFSDTKKLNEVTLEKIRKKAIAKRNKQLQLKREQPGPRSKKAVATPRVGIK